ncbi:MAG TPA: FkbM family methyltransferase, partial [Labilithrix sp.]|nr:FkbM family methyltransferase [Labilithrix sp.]
MKRPNLLACILSLGIDDDPERIAETRATLTPSPALTTTTEVVADVGAAARAFAASGADALLFLRAGERLEPGALTVIAAFAADDEAGAQRATGQLRVLEVHGDVMRRRIEPRLFRAGAVLEGGLTPWGVGPRIDVGARVIAPPSGEAARDVRTSHLAAALASAPDDARIHLELAELLLAVDAPSAAEHANLALAGGDVDGPEGPRFALALGEALFAAGAFEDTLGLVEACAARWPAFTELPFLGFRANRALGRLEETKSALLRCLEVGGDERFPGTLGAGTFVAAFELGLWFEAANDRVSALRLHTAASPHHPAAEQRRLALSSPGKGGVPGRLAEGGNVATKATRYGTMSYLVTDTFVGRALDVYGEWCASEIDLLVRSLREGDVVVDVGANIGSHTVPLAKAIGARGRLIAVEPQRTAHALLSANAATNGLLHVDCMRAAAGSAAGTVRIPTLDPGAPCNVGAAEVITDASSTAGEAVACIAIDDLDLPACRLLKIDAEGFEVQVLEGARATIARHRPILFVENDTTVRSAACLRAVRELGYRAYWHVARYYRPDNFFANPEDVFADYQPQANLVCVP